MLIVGLRVAAVLFSAVLVTGCSSSTTSGQARSQAFKTVHVRIKITQPNHDVIVKPTAAVTDINYGSDTEFNVMGTVIVTARPGPGPGKFNQHFLTGTLILKDGSRVDCSEPRGFFWNSNRFERVELPCDDVVSVQDVALFELQP